jgi:hypothetical protein
MIDHELLRAGHGEVAVDNYYPFARIAVPPG